MWIERTPNEGETVRVEFSESTNIGTKIGVFLKYHFGKLIIDFGDHRKYLDRMTTFYIWKNE